MMKFTCSGWDLAKGPCQPSWIERFYQAANVAYREKIPAAELSDDQRIGILLTIGVKVKIEDGKLVTVDKVGIQDRGDGGYIVGVLQTKRPTYEQ